MKKLLAAAAFSFVVLLASGQDKFTDPRDGNVYGTINVNGATWMKENLRFMSTSGAYCFDNDKNNLPIYGALYEWQTANAVCPSGWHLPSGDEFSSLINFLEQKDSWGKGPSDPSKFNIQLGGQQDYEGVFSEVDESGYYWTSTDYDTNHAEYFSYLLMLDMKVVDISRKADIDDVHGTEKVNKYSVRCVMDQTKK
jgi:uncharacterized protein (TIGR02145 family)